MIVNNGILYLSNAQGGRKMRKIFCVFITVFAITYGSAVTSFAGQWIQETSGWWYQNDDGSFPSNGWQWIDGNGDGVSESYYFDERGYLCTDTITPDGYTVNQDGAWVIDGNVQTQGNKRNESIKTDENTYIGRWNREYYGNSAGGVWSSPEREVVISKKGNGNLKIEWWMIEKNQRFLQYEFDLYPAEDGTYYIKPISGKDLQIAYDGNILEATYYYAAGDEMISYTEGGIVSGFMYEYYTRIQ